MTRTIAIVALLLAGCEPDGPVTDWQTAPRTHVCTPEQMTKVERETIWCRANTSYLSTYCYGAAIVRNCTKRTP